MQQNRCAIAVVKPGPTVTIERPSISDSVFKDFHEAFQRADIPASTPDSRPCSAGFPRLPTPLSADMEYPLSQGTPAPNPLRGSAPPTGPAADDLEGFLGFVWEHLPAYTNFDIDIATKLTMALS
ncbi:hypothetical protein SAICODRAFT_30846 [Saitoella complicata NRRL Y-17804]|nr:uncharacterized protein SAICODRAFT_30846 [Saitoella complicata NRRL Y-17804]ODQ52027.1 hypothetical protein SAICODRAFT_30846 [Saitoella complicata NRRL Y-17804]